MISSHAHDEKQHATLHGGIHFMWHSDTVHTASLLNDMTEVPRLDKSVQTHCFLFLRLVINNSPSPTVLKRVMFERHF